MGMSHAYGAPADKESMKTLLADAVEMGYTLFDTAEIYGTDTNPHDNEELLGEALKPYRDKVVITTKFGLTFDKSHEPGPYPLIPDSTPDSIMKAVDGSLRRLQTDHIDLYLQHRIDPEVEPEIVADTMSQLIQEGKILHWGISETNEEYLRRAHAVCPVTAIQNRYSMMARWHEDIFPTLEELNVGFIAFSPLANGLLSDFYTADSKFNPKMIIAQPCLSSAVRVLRKTRCCLNLYAASLKRNTPHHRRFPLRGCCKNHISCLSPAHATLPTERKHRSS